MSTIAGKLWSNKRYIIAGGIIVYAGSNFINAKRKERIANTIHPNTVLKLRLTGSNVVETPQSNAASLFKIFRNIAGDTEDQPKILALVDIVRAIHFAQTDDRVVGIVADMRSSPMGGPPRGEGRLGWAQAREIREAILEFKRVKKLRLGDEAKMTFIAFADTFDQQLLYYLASGFDQVFLQPTGTIGLVGLQRSAVFFKTLLERVGIAIHAETRQEFKSVLQPFTATEFSKEQRDNLLATLTSLNGQVVNEIAESRAAKLARLQPGEIEATPASIIQRSMDTGPVMAGEGVACGLLDGISYAQEIKRERLDNSKLMNLTHYGKVREQEIQSRYKRLGLKYPTIGLVYSLGTIKRGSGMYSAENISSALSQASKDKNVKALVLRIDSGGGDVVTSDTIGEQVRQYQTEQKKPVIASFGNVAASGAYFITCGCDRILADALTITGSIGVATLRPHVLPRLLDNLGINVETLSTSENTLANPLVPLEGEALARYKKNVDYIYQVFLNKVAQGRNMTLERVDGIAGGRIFSGNEALQVGLIDQIGGIRVAIAEAAKLSTQNSAQSSTQTSTQTSTLATTLATTPASDHGQETHKGPENMEDYVNVQVFPRRKFFFERFASRNALSEGFSQILKEAVLDTASYYLEELSSGGGEIKLENNNWRNLK